MLVGQCAHRPHELRSCRLRSVGIGGRGNLGDGERRLVPAGTGPLDDEIVRPDIECRLRVNRAGDGDADRFSGLIEGVHDRPLGQPEREGDRRDCVACPGCGTSGEQRDFGIPIVVGPPWFGGQIHRREILGQKIAVLAPTFGIVRVRHEEVHADAPARRPAAPGGTVGGATGSRGVAQRGSGVDDLGEPCRGEIARRDHAEAPGPRDGRDQFRRGGTAGHRGADEGEREIARTEHGVQNTQLKSGWPMRPVGAVETGGGRRGWRPPQIPTWA